MKCITTNYYHGNGQPLWLKETKYFIQRVPERQLPELFIISKKNLKTSTAKWKVNECLHSPNHKIVSSPLGLVDLECIVLVFVLSIV